MLISVIVPVYNAEEFLPRAIKSVLGQSYKKIELILINDGSTDKSEKICQQYALGDKRIKVISQKNQGPAAARNTGVRHASGDLVFFLDADDFIEKNAIETLVTKSKKYQPDLVMGNFSKLDRGKIIKQSVSFSPGSEPFTGRNKVLSKMEIVAYVRHFLKYPSNHLISYCWARLYKLSIIKKNKIFAHEDMRLFEDFVFNLDYLKHTNKIVFVNQPLYIYVMHSDHVSASMAIIKADSLLHDMEVFKRKATEFLQPTKTKEIGQALVHYAIIFFLRSCRQITGENRKMIYQEISKVIKAPIFRSSLQSYSPLKGNSKILPWLMKLKLVSLTMLVCQYKAYKRYGKPSN